MSGTEESILSTIPDLGESSSSSDSVADSSPAETSSQPSGGSEPAQTSAQPTTGGQPQEQVRRRHDGLVEVPSQEQPNTRDLVDPITGKTVAKGGIERRVFEDGQRHARENATLKTQLQNTTRQLANINQVTQEAVRLNVAPEDQLAAIRVMSDFLRDPVKTLEYLVAEVKSKGYPIPFLQQGVTPGMDLNAIQRMIDNKMAPITQQQQSARMQAEQKAAAEADLNAFLEDNQEASSNLDVLAEMLNARPGLSLHNAYTTLIRWAHQNQLDWTQPLKQQIAARQQPTPQQPPQQQAPQRAIPTGRASGGNGATPVGNGAAPQYSENASWADIIRQSMHDHGITLS